MKKLISFIIAIIIIPMAIKDSYAIEFRALTYEDLIATSLAELTTIRLKTKKDYVITAYNLELISKEEYHAARAGKSPSRLFAATLIRNILDKNTNYYQSPYEDIASLSVNFLYYNMIIEPNGKLFNPNRTVTPLTWYSWLKNAGEWKRNRLLFFENQMNTYPSITERIIDTGFADLEEGVDIQIYNALKSGFTLGSSGIRFLLEETKSELADLNFKDQLSEDWMAFNRYNGELTSGASIDVTINYETNTEVYISFIYPENYRTNREYLIREISGIIDKEKLKEMSLDDSIRWVSQYIISNTSYPEEMKESTRYAYSALYDGVAVCTGYSDLFSWFMNLLEIENIRVWGYYGETLHTWNLVKTENGNLFVDTTLSSEDDMRVLVDALDGYTWDENIISVIF